MFRHIFWSVFLRAKSERSSKTLLKRLSKLLGLPIQIETCERYWKDKALYVATFTTPLNLSEPAQAVFEALRTASALAHRWNVPGPQEYEGDRCDFEGWAQPKKFRMAGLEGAEFQIRNF